LLSHWQKGGKWPDFCFEPDLAYDCKAEAAKLAATARKGFAARSLPAPGTC
jgi:hypothetical protein